MLIWQIGIRKHLRVSCQSRRLWRWVQLLWPQPWRPGPGSTSGFSPCCSGERMACVVPSAAPPQQHPLPPPPTIESRESAAGVPDSNTSWTTGGESLDIDITWKHFRLNGAVYVKDKCFWTYSHDLYLKDNSRELSLYHLCMLILWVVF